MSKRCAISSGRSGLDSTRVSWAFTLPTLTIPLPLAEGNNRDGNSNGYRPTLVGACLLRRPLGGRVPSFLDRKNSDVLTGRLQPCFPVTLQSWFSAFEQRLVIPFAMISTHARGQAEA